jgi:hypothetical protein
VRAERTGRTRFDAMRRVSGAKDGGWNAFGGLGLSEDRESGGAKLGKLRQAGVYVFQRGLRAPVWRGSGSRMRRG